MISSWVAKIFPDSESNYDCERKISGLFLASRRKSRIRDTSYYIKMYALVWLNVFFVCILVSVFNYQKIYISKFRIRFSSIKNPIGYFFKFNNFVNLQRERICFSWRLDKFQTNQSNVAIKATFISANSFFPLSKILACNSPTLRYFIICHNLYFKRFDL